MKPGPLVAAALAAAALAARWRALSVRLRVAAVAAAVLLAVWGSGAVHLPKLDSIANEVGATLGPYTYAVVGVLAFLETGAGIGLVAPGELAVVIGGVTAGQGHTELVPLIALVWVCAWAGDITSYALGRRLGRGFLLANGSALKLTPERLRRVEMFLHRHGRKTIIVGRFIGLVRALAPFAAGAARMPARRFVPTAFIAAGIWSAAFTALGYAFWHSFDHAAAFARQGSIVLVGGVIVVGAAIAVHRRSRGGNKRSPGGDDRGTSRGALGKVL